MQMEKHAFFVYLRPWVLDRSHATVEVPHIADLDLLPSDVDQEVQHSKTLLPERRWSVPLTRRRIRGKQNPNNINARRSFAESWRHYIRGNVVSRHAQKFIVQFMAANCGKTTRREDLVEDADGERTKSASLPENSLPLARVHNILDRV